MQLGADLLRAIEAVAASCEALGQSEEAVDTSLHALTELEQQLAEVEDQISALPALAAGPDEVRRHSILANERHPHSLAADQFNLPAVLPLQALDLPADM